MIKIATGWSDKGGSTFAFINLTNALNEAGYETILYGPHEWHLDKCKSGLLKDFKSEKDDLLIVHFLQLNERPNCKKVILNCHETNVFEVSNVKQFWDTVVFLNEKQKNYHSKYYGPYETIPNLREKLIKKPKDKSVEKVAGIIGSFDLNKRTERSIMRALNEGYEKVLLFGNVSDVYYYNSVVKPIIDEHDNVIEYGFISDKQKMYDMIGAAFLSSKREVASLVKDECETTGTKFYGNKATDHDVKELTNKGIIEEWVKLLEL